MEPKVVVYVDSAISGKHEADVPAIMLLLKLLAVGALGTAGLKPVKVPPLDDVALVHQTGVPDALFA